MAWGAPSGIRTHFLVFLQQSHVTCLITILLEVKIKPIKPKCLPKGRPSETDMPSPSLYTGETKDRALQ